VDVWLCTGCGAATLANDTRLLLLLGWQLQSLRRDQEHRFALCPACASSSELPRG
jgi:hypothetical protein